MEAKYEKEKWEKMNPEERAQFKQQWRKRCSSWGKLRDTTKSETE